MHVVQKAGLLVSFKTNPSRHEVGTVMESAEVESQFLPPSVKPVQGKQSFAEFEPAGDPVEGSQSLQIAVSFSTAI